MNYLPVSLNIEQKHVLIAGGGKAALEKLQMLQKFSCQITLVGEDFPPEITAQRTQRGLVYHLRPFRREDLAGVLLVYACSSDREINRIIKKEANALGILVNTPDDPELCDFLTPALFTEGSMMVAVSSGGTDVPKTILWRNRIKQLFTDNGLKL
ncbi:MAG: bifunctional precorrin-2 dehydrogenase/sirohydrochlorin ferrochelatase [Chlorobiaceae bacterium]